MNSKDCNCEPYQCCKKCMDKFDFRGKHVFEPIWKGLIIYFQLAKTMEEAWKKWGDTRLT